MFSRKLVIFLMIVLITSQVSNQNINTSSVSPNDINSDTTESSPTYFPFEQTLVDNTKSEIIDPKYIYQNDSMIIIGDNHDNTLKFYDHSGNFLSSIALNEPGYDFATNGTHYFVVEYWKISIYDTLGNLVQQITDFSDPPDDIAINSTHMIVTAPPLSGAMEIFTIDGTRVGNFADYPVSRSVLDVDFNGTDILITEVASGEVRTRILDSSGVEKNIIVYGVSMADATSIHFGDDHIYIFSSATLRKFDTTGNYIGTFTEYGGKSDEYVDLVDLSGNSTHLFMSDQDNHKAMIANKQTEDISTIGYNPASILQPTGMTSNSTHVLVADELRDKIVVLDRELQFVDTIGYYGFDPGEIFAIGEITMNDSHIFISEEDVFVSVYDLAGNFKFEFGSQGSGAGQFNTISRIHVDQDYIYVLDGYHENIQVFDLSGNYITTIVDTNPDGIDRPNSMVSNSSHLLISDGNREDIGVYDKTSFSRIGIINPPDPIREVGALHFNDGYYYLSSGFHTIFKLDTNYDLINTITYSDTEYFVAFNDISTINGEIYLSHDRFEELRLQRFIPISSGAPTNLKVTATNSTVDMNWTNTEIPAIMIDKFETYQIHRAGPYSSPPTGEVTTSYLDNVTGHTFSEELTQDGIYVYEVQAIYENGILGSSQVSVDIVLMIDTAPNSPTESPADSSTSDSSVTSSPISNSTDQSSIPSSNDDTDQSPTTDLLGSSLIYTLSAALILPVLIRQRKKKDRI